MPQAKYDYKVMGKAAKNSRNKAHQEIKEILGADDAHNFETVMDALNVVQSQLKIALNQIGAMDQRLVSIEEQLRNIKK